MHIARLLVLVLVAAAVLAVCARQVPLSGRRSESSSVLAEVDSSAQDMLDAEADLDLDMDMEAEAEVDADAGVDAEAEAEALPGEQCFSSHDALEPSGEASSTLYSYNSFCSSVVEHLADPFANEKEFREACNEKFGIDKCRHQCRELAQLYDQTLVGTKIGSEKYGLTRGNQAEYTMDQRDCENCLRHHQCSPTNALVTE